MFFQPAVAKPPSPSTACAINFSRDQQTSRITPTPPSNESVHD
jgi:hypothetical protein